MLDAAPGLAHEVAVAAYCTRLGAVLIRIHDRIGRSARAARLRDTAHARLWRRALRALGGDDVAEARLLLVAARKVASWHGEDDRPERNALGVLDGNDDD